jgi:bifunctional non-homologous end joining protein LigD
VSPKRRPSEPPDEKLARYRSMRDFDKTAEPAGAPEPLPADALRFVVQEHHATALHWDFRLERDGVLVSWAVPKGIPPNPKDNHLAVHTEDHPMEYLDFAGDIPEGEYGGGQVALWDTGTYATEKWREREVIVVLHGRRVEGRYALIQTNGRNWLMHRMDPPQDPDRRLVPDDIRPCAWRAGRLPRQPDGWSFEPVFGGHRVTVTSNGGRLLVRDEEGTDLTGKVPELSPMGRAIGAVEVVLEGELVADADTLAHRFALKSDSALRRAAQQRPIAFVATDVRWLEGHPTDELPFAERRRLLEELALSGPAWQTVPVHPGEGKALLAAARQQGLPGIVGRALDDDGPPLYVET